MKPIGDEVPLELATTIETTPGEEAGGMLTAMVLGDTTVTAEPDRTVEPNETVTPGVKFSPVITAVPPPPRGEESGVTEVVTGNCARWRITTLLEVSPTASHDDSAVQLTPLTLRTSEGEFWMIHDVPLKYSPIITPELPIPVASQDNFEIHDTLAKLDTLTGNC
jgi:hypothetical protein